MIKKVTYTCGDNDCNDRVCRNCFKDPNQKIITFINPYPVKNNTENEYGSDSSENDKNNSSYDSFNGNFNDEYT